MRAKHVFLGPALAVLAMVTVYPLLHVIWSSFHQRLLIFDINELVGLDNYVRIFGDDRYWHAVLNTFYFTGVSVSIELVLGVAFAMLLDSVVRGRGALRAIVLLPWAIPTVVSAKMWEWIYNPDFGILNHLLGTDVNWLGNPFWALNAAVFMDVWKTTPFVTLLITAALQEIPDDLYRAARVDGADRTTIFRRITLPLIAPMIVVILIFRTLDAFRVFDAVYVLTGGGPAGTTETLSIYAYNLLFQTLQFGYGSTVALTVFVFVGLLTLLYLAILRRATR
jgi:multiple sugar transport system permease protein